MSYDPRKLYAATHARLPRHRITPWILGGAMATALMLAIRETLDTAPGDGSLPNFLAFWLPLVAAGMSPLARDTWLTERGRESYDEFERLVLFRATNLAYLILLLAVAAFAGWCALARFNGWPAPTQTRDWFGWVAALLGCGVCLPILLAELMLPLPPAGEADA